MVTMASMAPGLPTSPTPTHHLICCQFLMHNRFHRVVVLACILFSFTLSWLASAGNCDPVSYAADELHESLVYDDDAKGCDAYEDDGLTTVYAQKNSQGCSGVSNVFSRPDSLGFLTTLAHFLVGNDSCEGSSVEDHLQSGRKSRSPPDELLNAIKVSCFQVDINSGKDGPFSSGKENLHPDDVTSCERAVISGAWMPETNGLDIPVYKTSEEIRSKVPNGSLLPHVNVTPPFLDWGITHLYFPSKVFLTVANAHNESILQVYKPFGASLQCDIPQAEDLCSFLPKWRRKWQLKGDGKVWWLILHATLWMIWGERNKRIFQRTATDVEHLFEVIARIVKDWALKLCNVNQSNSRFFTLLGG